MTASHPCGPAFPDVRESSEVCLAVETNRDGKEESASIDGVASLVTTAAATWCLHAVSPHKTNALLEAFQQLLGTHHTLYEPAPPLSTNLSSRLSPPLGSMETSTPEQGPQEIERSRKREDAYAQAATVRGSEQDCQVQQPLVMEPSSRVTETELETSSAWAPSVPTPQKDPTIRPADAAGFDGGSNRGEDNEDVIPFFPVLHEILRGDWKDEGVKRGRTRKKKKGKGSGARVTGDTFVTPGKNQDPTSTGDSSAQRAGFVFDALHQSHASESSAVVLTSPQDGSSLNWTGRTFVETAPGEPQQVAACSSVVDNVGELQPYHQKQDTICASKTDAATAATATSQWNFTFSCRICGRNDTIEERTACCRACLVAQNTPLAQSGTERVVKDFSRPDNVCIICGMGRETMKASGTACADSRDRSNNVNHSTGILNTEKIYRNEETKGHLTQPPLPSHLVEDARNGESDPTRYIPEQQEQMPYSEASLSDEEAFLSNLLLPPAVPVSSALERTSPSAVRLWHLHAQRRNVVHETTDVEEKKISSCGSMTEKRTGSDVYSSHTDNRKLNADPHSGQANVRRCEDAPYSEDDDDTAMFDLLKLVQPRKISAERRKEMAEEGIHMRAQLACLVDAREPNPLHLLTEKFSQSDAATRREELSSERKAARLAECAQHNGIAERPQARKLTSAVLNALKKLPEHEREEEALLELLLSWYYAGFFTGRLSMCSSV